MTKIEQSRKLIKENCERIFDSGKNILLEWGTGCGKSFAAINLQARMNSQKTFICVAESAHIDNWTKEYIKHGHEDLLKSTEIFCYASLKKYANKSCDLLILDEAHHAFSDIRMPILSSIKTKRFLGLSATISNNDKEFLNAVFKNLTTYEISLEEAIDMDLIPKPIVYVVPLELDNKDRCEIVSYKRGSPTEVIKCNFNQRNAYIFNKNKYKSLNLEIQCTQLEKYIYLDGIYEFAKRSRRSGWLRHGGIRKRYLSECKTEYMKYLVHKIRDNRFICFCGSIEQAEELGGNNCIHSKKDAKKIISKFNNYEINSLFAVGMLVEGQNLPGIEVAVIGQLDGQERPLIQKFGRGLRAEFPEVYILYFKNTKDEDYLQNVIKNIPEKFIKYIEL